MSFSTKLLFLVTAILFNCSVWANGDIYLYGQAPKDVRIDGSLFGAQPLTKLTKKYHMYFDPVGPPNELYFPVSARKLRSGVYLLQSTLENGKKIDLIFKNYDEAKKFETELKNTAKTDKFYAEPVGYPGMRKVIAVGYMQSYPGDPARLKIRYYFIANPWDWKPQENE